MVNRGELHHYCLFLIPDEGNASFSSQNFRYHWNGRTKVIKEESREESMKSDYGQRADGDRGRTVPGKSILGGFLA